MNPLPVNTARDDVIADLIKRAESAEKLDRELDRLIHFHVISPWVGEKCVKWIPAAFEGPNDFLWWTAEREAEGKEGYHDGWEALSASVDAVLDAIDELRQLHPHMTVTVSGTLDHPHDYFKAEITWPSHEMQGRGRTAALALCVAFLKAWRDSQ